MIGFTNGRKDFDFTQTVICARCGSYGRYKVFMTFTQLLLFFIPCFRWNRQYFVEMSCCGAVYALDPEIGRRIASGEDISIRPEDLTLMSGGRTYGRSGYDSTYGQHLRCSYCGYETDEDFEFCPKCGRRF